jgi:hypothetical protein
MHTPNDDRLIRALEATSNASLTGTLHVTHSSGDASIFFEAGSAYFGMLDGQRPTVESFEAKGIERNLVKAAAAAPRARDRFADALMSVGIPGSMVRSYARDTLIETVQHIAGLQDARFSADLRRHPFGPAFLFPVEQLLEDAGVTPSSNPPADTPACQPQADTRFMTSTSSDEALSTDDEGGLRFGLRRRTALRPAMSATE